MGRNQNLIPKGEDKKEVGNRQSGVGTLGSLLMAWGSEKGSRVGSVSRKPFHPKGRRESAKKEQKKVKKWGDRDFVRK